MRTNFVMEDFKHITMVRGDTLSFGLVIEDDNGNPMDVDSAFFTAKRNYTDEIALFQKKIGEGITKVGDGTYTVRLRPDETANAEAGNYFYDFSVGVNGDVFTLMRGVLEILMDVTIGG